MNAAAVSRKLRAGGLRPLPSGTTRMREGVRVSRCAQAGVVALVSVDVDSPTLEARLIADVADVLTEAGLAFDRRCETFFYVKAAA